MAKNRPTTGQQGWGGVLNAHLNQLMPNGGGINFSDTRPTTLTTDDDGYTMVDTLTREIIRWDGNDWVILMGGTPEGRNYATGDVTLYVRQDGDDNNDGLTNDATGAFKTIQKAVDTMVGEYDMRGFKAKIQVADSPTPYDGFRVTKPLLNSGRFEIIGNETNPENVTIHSSLLTSSAEEGYSAVFVNNSASFYLGGFSLAAYSQSSTFTNYLINVYNARLEVGKLIFNSAGTGLYSRHITLADNSVYAVTKDYEIRGGAYAHITCYTDSTVVFSLYRNPAQDMSVSLSAGVTFSGIFLLGESSSKYILYVPGTGNFRFTGETNINCPRYRLNTYSYSTLSALLDRDANVPGNISGDQIDATSTIFTP